MEKQNMVHGPAVSLQGMGTLAVEATLAKI